ncbi:DUF2271 domain-containing protein [Luteococcus peritonei]|uniref:DUF2271 domain-containing protein n=1 Tax=Luteococcus peritonei TaxID=88874 RepID=A0ABW4RQX7_9ACTN
MTTSRFSQVSRRAFLGGASMAALTGLAACATTDSTSSATSGASSQASSPASTGPTTTPSAAATTSASTGQGGTLPATAQATVSFTYTASGGGMVKNPYYAVWVEDATGAFVKTLMLCHLSGQDRWLNELSAWYAKSGGTDTTTEGTKPAGSYDCTWDCTDADGNRVPAGRYNFCIEANREHGTESLVASLQTLGGTALDVDLGSNGELTTTHLRFTA